MLDAEIDGLCAASEPKLARLRARLGELGSALVAYSGGVDSTFVLRMGVEVLGDRCVGLLGESPSLAERERAQAVELARKIGARLVVVQARELEDERYSANPVDRCYYCKSELFDLCLAQRGELGLAAVLDGFNADDERDWRPGRRAGLERGVLSPLAEVGLTKAEVRAWSRRLDLPTWDKPAMPCLASRLPYGTKVTAERLAQVGGAEQDLWELGFRELRVRHHGEIARIELSEADAGRLLDGGLRARAVEALKRRGFAYVVLDLEPFRSGRLNDVAAIRPPASDGRG